MNADVRDRSREILRAELANAAADFCAQHGFETVTVDDIAQSIGISRATFFRYFATKEDAVITAVRSGRASLADGVRAQASGITAWTATRAALQPQVSSVRADPDRLRARLLMISTVDGLRARLSLDRATERESLAAALAERISEKDAAPAIAGAALAAVDLAWIRWAADPRADLDAELDRAFALVGGAAEVLLER